MPVYKLGDDPIFPPVEGAEDGLVAIGGDLSVTRLVAAYRNGLFPWNNYRSGPIRWHSPDPRWVVLPDSFRLPKRMQRTLRNHSFRLTSDTAFREVISACAAAFRPFQRGTWIHDRRVESYVALHDAGWAHSMEVWEGTQLVGGLYGVQVGALFCGESMFALRPDASKVAFVHLVRQLERWGVELIDCQVYNQFLHSLGAREVPRQNFLSQLKEICEGTSSSADWKSYALKDDLLLLP